MKKLHFILFSLLFTISYGQFSNVGQVSVADGGILYTDIELQNKGTLVVADTGKLYIDAGLDNSTGSLVMNESILHLGSGQARSSGVHNLKFNLTTPDVVKYVELNKTNGTYNVDPTDTGLLKITHTFTSIDGILNAGDSIVLVSTSEAETAIVPQSSGGTVNELRVERFITQIDAYRLLTSPVDSDRAIFHNWQNGGINEANRGTHITGGSSALGFDQNATGYPSMFTFNLSSQSWVKIPNTNATNLINGEPYFIIIRGDRSIDLTINDPTSTVTNLSSTGTLHIGTKTLTGSSLENGFTAVGNPFQAPVDLQRIYNNSSTNIKEAYIVWDPNITNPAGFQGNFVTVPLDGSPNTVPGSDADIYLQPGQSAYLQTDLAGTAASTIFNETDKVGRTQLTEVYKTTEDKSLDGFLRLSMYSAKAKPFIDRAFDGVILKFGEKFAENSNKSNINKLFGFGQNLSIRGNDENLSIHSRILPSQLDEIINLSLHQFVSKSGKYTFAVNLKGMGTLPNGIILWDKYKDSYTQLADQQTINFEVDSSIPESGGIDRFALVFEYKTLGVDDQFLGDLTIYPNPVTSDFINIRYSQINNKETTIELFEILGRRIFSRTYKSEPNKLENLNLPTGVYLLNIKQDNFTKTFKIIKE